VASKPGQPPAILTLGKFLDLRTVLPRYFDLLILVKSKMPERKEHQCLICFQENCSKTVVLSCCSYNLCVECYERWVLRRLNCPFCRHEFEKESVRSSQWELLEYRVKDAIDDIRQFESKLETVWTTLEFSSASSKLLATYEMKERTMGVREKEGIIIVEENNKG
jgi:hypothetical protein